MKRPWTFVQMLSGQLAVLETHGRGIAPTTVPQTVVCDWRGEAQAGDLGSTLQHRGD